MELALAHFFNTTRKTIMKKKDEQSKPDSPARDKNDREFPGYPHYPPSEDLLPKIHPEKITLRPLEDEDVRIVMGTEADVNKEDLALLGQKEHNMDGGDDELLEHYEGLDDTDLDGDPLNESAGSLTSTGEDLDIPGVESDALDGLNGLEDEENDYYSLGGDSKDALEEDKGE